MQNANFDRIRGILIEFATATAQNGTRRPTIGGIDYNNGHSFRILIVIISAKQLSSCALNKKYQ